MPIDTFSFKRFPAILIPVLLFFLPFSGKSQINDKSAIDSAVNMIWTGANFAYHFPGGQIAEIFKGNFNVGTGFTYKTASNWTWSANFNYLFGSKMKRNDIEFMKSLFGDVFNSHNQIIDGNGQSATVYFEGRYWNVGAGIGKIIPVNRWKNSGIWINTNFGFFQHKIFINIFQNDIPQLSDDYKKGYDRRSSGFFMSQFIGYLFMQKVRVASFYGGIEIYEIWTKPDRSYIFTEGPTEGMKNKFSLLVGIKIGWVVPLYEKKKTTNFYTF